MKIVSFHGLKYRIHKEDFVFYLEFINKNHLDINLSSKMTKQYIQTYCKIISMFLFNFKNSFFFNILFLQK
jgi:hypothetical protein